MPFEEPFRDTYAIGMLSVGFAFIITCQATVAEEGGCAHGCREGGNEDEELHSDSRDGAVGLRKELCTPCISWKKCSSAAWLHKLLCRGYATYARVPQADKAEAIDSATGYLLIIRTRLSSRSRGRHWKVRSSSRGLRYTVPSRMPCRRIAPQSHVHNQILQRM